MNKNVHSGVGGLRSWITNSSKEIGNKNWKFYPFFTWVSIFLYIWQYILRHDKVRLHFLLRWNFQIGQILGCRIRIDQLEKLLPNPTLSNHCTLQNIVFIYSKSKPVYPHVVENLTLRRPLRRNLRIGLFFSSHGSALTAFQKRWKNIPHKSSTVDFFQYFIFW